MAHRFGLAAVAFGAFLVAAGGNAVAQTASKCTSKEIAAAGKKAGGKAKCWAKATAKGLAVDPACLSKVETKFSGAYAKAQGKGDCKNGTTAGTIETKVNNFITDLVTEINGNTGTPTASKCSSKELAAAGKKAGGVLKCYAKAAGKGDNSIIPGCIGTASTKFGTSWGKATSSPPCNTAVTQNAIETKVDNFASDVNSELTATGATTTTSTTTIGSTTTATTTVGSTTTSTTMVGGCDCCGSLPSLLSFTTGSSGCGTNPPGSVSPARCVQDTSGGTNGTACTTDATCGNGLCRGHLDCTGLYFGGGQPSGINLPATIPDLGLSYSKIASCTSGNPNLSSTAAADVPGPGCPTPTGTPTYGQRHCTSPGCLFGAPLAIPNPSSTATGTCVVNVIANRPGVGTGSAVCTTGAVNSLTLPLDSQIYLTGAIEPVRVCSTCVGGTPGVCGSGTCGGGPRDTMPCTPETNALNGSYPTSHDCPPPQAPMGQLVASCGLPSGSFIGCLPVDFGLSSGTQTKTSFPTGAQVRVFCGFCFDPSVSLAFENPPHPCTADAQCTNCDPMNPVVCWTSCQQQSNGAFRNSFATTISEVGNPANACIADGANHPATLVSLFCIPPSYNGIVDPSGELPGPGAVSLPGTSQFIP